MVFYSERLKFVWHQLVKVSMIYGFLLLDFVTSAMKEVFFFFVEDRKKEGSFHLLWKTKKKTSSLNPTHLLNFILTVKRVSAIKIVARTLYLCSDEYSGCVVRKGWQKKNSIKGKWKIGKILRFVCCNQKMYFMSEINAFQSVWLPCVKFHCQRRMLYYRNQRRVYVYILYISIHFFISHLDQRNRNNFQSTIYVN